DGGGKSGGAVLRSRNFERDFRVGEGALRAHDALRDGWLRHEIGARDFGCGEAAEETKSQRNTRIRRENRMARNKYQPKEIVFNVALLREFEICHGGFLLRFQLAAQFFVLSFEKFRAAKMIERAMFGGGHEPRAGIIGYARLGPFFECGDERVLRQFFGEANVAYDAREAG